MISVFSRLPGRTFPALTRSVALLIVALAGVLQITASTSAAGMDRLRPTDRWMAKEGCLFIDEPSAAAESVIEAGSDSGIAPNPDRQSQPARQLGELITQSIIKAIESPRRFSSTAPVDLFIWTRTALDSELGGDVAASDPYWKYYHDCDRWEVEFGEEQEVELAQLQIEVAFWQQLSQNVYQLFEFALVENQRCSQLPPVIKMAEVTTTANDDSVGVGADANRRIGAVHFFSKFLQRFGIVGMTDDPNTEVVFSLFPGAQFQSSEATISAFAEQLFQQWPVSTFVR